MAKKKGMASGGYEIGRLVDQSGGMVDSVVHPTLLQDHEAALLKNVSLDEKGTVKPCLGRIERFEEPFDPDNPCNGITAFYPDTTTSRLIIGAGSKLFKDAPHLITRWTEQAHFEEAGSVRINCDTATKPGELTVTTPPTATFARASVAYLPDGTIIIVDNPRYVDGKYTKAIMVEEGTTNLANNPTFSGAVGTTPSGWNSDVTIRQDDFFGQLINVAELLCVSGNVFDNFGTGIVYPLAHNATYTISFWARGTMELTYELSTNRGIASATWKSKPPMSLQWQRYEVTIETASSGFIYPFWWYLNNANDVNVGKWVRIARIQLEQKPYATSFIDGTAPPKPDHPHGGGAE